MLKIRDIRSLTLIELENFLEERNEKKFRAKQIYQWLWNKSVRRISDMTNLSLDLRQLLEQHFTLKTVVITDSQISKDRTIKNAFTCADGNIVEGVLIPTSTRMTACISSQVGCSLTCKFCATGKLERLRNLEDYEIYDQLVLLKNQARDEYEIPLSNIVYMGMGEPLLNYKNVLSSIDKISSPSGLGISAQRITVSTAGIAKMIRKLGDDNVKFNLALSLHAANDDKRGKIMPINEHNNLDELASAMNYFYEKTGTRVTYEYIVFKDFNDTLQDAQELADFCRKSPAKVNIIEYNPIEDAEFKQTTTERLFAFTQFLESQHIIVNVRRSRGKDIDAACGQLANKSKK